MNIEEIKKAVEEGKTVKHMTDDYEVIKDKVGQFLIVCLMNQYTIGLTWKDGKTLNGAEDEFYIKENDNNNIKEKLDFVDRDLYETKPD